MTNFITPEGLKNLDNYKYKPGVWTTIEDGLQPYWTYTASLVPDWVAPNLITFSGLLLLLSSCLILIFYDATRNHEIPNWCFFYSAFCLWGYHTLDAIDGKHARRTNSSSALGQLFDHGCDAFSVALLQLTLIFGGQLNN